MAARFLPTRWTSNGPLPPEASQHDGSSQVSVAGEPTRSPGSLRVGTGPPPSGIRRPESRHLTVPRHRSASPASPSPPGPSPAGVARHLARRPGPGRLQLVGANEVEIAERGT